MARAPASLSEPRSATAASLFGEIYGGRQPALPGCVSDALDALERARQRGQVALR